MQEGGAMFIIIIIIIVFKVKTSSKKLNYLCNIHNLQ